MEGDLFHVFLKWNAVESIGLVGGWKIFRYKSSLGKPAPPLHQSGGPGLPAKGALGLIIDIFWLILQLVHVSCIIQRFFIYSFICSENFSIQVESIFLFRKSRSFQ